MKKINVWPLEAVQEIPSRGDIVLVGERSQKCHFPVLGNLKSLGRPQAAETSGEKPRKAHCWNNYGCLDMP
jgi:hypothetical protein